MEELQSDPLAYGTQTEAQLEWAAPELANPFGSSQGMAAGRRGGKGSKGPRRKPANGKSNTTKDDEELGQKNGGGDDGSSDSDADSSGQSSSSSSDSDAEHGGRQRTAAKAKAQRSRQNDADAPPEHGNSGREDVPKSKQQAQRRKREDKGRLSGAPAKKKRRSADRTAQVGHTPGFLP